MTAPGGCGGAAATAQMRRDYARVSVLAALDGARGQALDRRAAGAWGRPSSPGAPVAPRGARDWELPAGWGEALGGAGPRGLSPAAGAAVALSIREAAARLRGGSPYSRAYAAPKDPWGVPSATTNPAPDGTCARDCTASMVGDPDGCSVYAPVVDSKPLDYAGLASAETLGTVAARVYVTATSAEVKLLRTALGLLLTSLDLVTWAFCLGRGMWDLVGLLRLYGYIAGTTPLTVVVVEVSSGAAMSIAGTGTIWLNRTGSQVGSILELWGAGDEDSRACAALQMSSLLLHELTHLAAISLVDVGGWTGLDDEAEHECYPSYMIGNAYQWATFQRYWNAGEPACCTSPSADWVFYCENAIFSSNQPGCGPSDTDTWLEEVEEELEEFGEDLEDTLNAIGEWLAGAFGGDDTGGGGGIDTICHICPELCAGDLFLKGGPEDEAWLTCLAKLAAMVDDSEPLPLERV